MIVLNVQTMEEANGIPKSLQEEQSVTVSQSNEMKTLKKFLEEVEADKAILKKKATEWAEKNDKMKKSTHEWADKFNNLKERHPDHYRPPEVHRD